MTHVTHSRMLSKRRSNQAWQKELRRAHTQARRKAVAEKSPGKAKA
jgi:hypothetical protein